MEIINTANFDETIKEGVVLVDFFANWCGPCKMLAPILEQVAEELTDIKIVKVDVDESEELAMRFGIMSIPTMIIFKDGQPVKKAQGFQPKDTLISFINAVK